MTKQTKYYRENQGSGEGNLISCNGESGGQKPGRCFLCGGSSGPVVLREAGYSGRACQCGVVYIDPNPLEGSVDPTEDHHLDTYYSLPAGLRLDWVASLRSSGRLLEVGCGRGHFLAKAKQRGYDVAAVEPNPTCARQVSETLGIEVEQALIEESRLPEASFDVVFHVDLLSHFPDPVQGLKAMAERLRPGGLLCFEIGVFGGLAPFWYRWVGRPGYPQHRWFYSEEALHKLLQRAGLKVERVKRFGLFPATILSTIGTALFSRALPKPREPSGQPTRATGFYRWYSWLQYVLRYHIGAFVPPVGPRTLFVAARRTGD